MNLPDEKERNVTVEKIIRLLTPLGSSRKPMKISDFLEQEKNVSGRKSEEDYRKEQEEWLKTIHDKKK